MKNKLFTNSIIFTGMTVLQRGIAFLLLPLYTGILSPEQYGISNMVNSVCAIYILSFSFAMDDTVARFYFQYKKDKNKLKEVIGTLLIISLSVTLGGTLLLIIFNWIFLKPFLKDIVLFPNIILGLVPVACSSVYSIVQKILIIEGKAFRYSVNTSLFFLINTFLTILFIINLGMGATGLLLASAVTYFIFFIYSIIYLLPNISIKLNTDIACAGLKYGLVLLPNRIASWGLVHLNKIVLGNFISVTAVGIYNIALSLSSILSILANSFSFALQPWVYKQLENGENGKKNIVNLTNVVSILFCFVGFGISLFSKEVIVTFINERYFDSVSIIPILVWGTVTSAYSTLFVYVLFYYKSMTKYIAISTFAGATINICLSLVFIPHIGIMGSAISCAIADFTICIIKTSYSLKALKIKMNVIPMHLLAMLCMTIAFAAQYFDLGLLLKMLLFIMIFTVAIIANKNQMQSFYKLIRKKE